jgi:hypothetical protein
LRAIFPIGSPTGYRIIQDLFAFQVLGELLLGLVAAHNHIGAPKHIDGPQGDEIRISDTDTDEIKRAFSGCIGRVQHARGLKE